MSSKSELEKITNSELNKKFRETVKKIGKYLELSLPEFIPIMRFQEEDEQIEIPDLGRSFGVVLDAQEKQLVLAKWLPNLLVREQRGLKQFLMAREGFRLFLKPLIPLPDPFHRLTEIVLQNIAILWLIEEYGYTLLSSPILYVRGRVEAFEEEGILKSEHWVYFLQNCNKHNISALQVFNTMVSKSNNAYKEEQTVEDLGWELIYWLKDKMPSPDSSGLPIHIEKERNFNVIEALASVDYKESSAKNIGEMIDRSHNVVNIAFKELPEKYNFQWWPSINLLTLRLYPFFFRITLTGRENKAYLVKRIKQNKYVRFLRENINEYKDEIILVGYLECPLLSQQKLFSYFERLEKKGHLKDYFFKQIREKTISFSISRKLFKPTKTIYQKLFQKPKENYSTIRTLNKKYDITNVSEHKKEVFAEDVLIFISTLMARPPGKAHYTFKPIEIIYDLCEKNGIDTTDTSAVMYYISQMEIRCLRLEVFDYYLNFREFGTFGKALYFELTPKPPSEKIKYLYDLLKRTTEMVWLTFYDRLVIYFPQVKFDCQIREEIERLLKEQNIEYFVTQINYDRDLRTPKILFHELYDFSKQQWIY
ncbi:MAG: hypothetical protein GF308_06055 [Candidatus Heimdallarchaeota archaeon]|nr:hypothetical protein [Candidatus Heimdallarchaeota archaeon]